MNTSHLNSLNTKKRNNTYNVGNLGPDLGQEQKFGGVKPVNGILSQASPPDNLISNYGIILTLCE
jgi:hypothetical protein